MPLTKASIKRKANLTHDVIELELQVEGEFEAEAGQFVNFKVTDKVPPCFRAYSLASKPKDGIFDLCIKVVEGGRASNWFNNLELGATVEFLGPSGKFVFQGTKKKHLFVATGTGLAPFRSMLQEQVLKRPDEEFILVFGVRHISDIFYRETFEELAKQHVNFKFCLTLSQPEDENWAGERGRVTELLGKLELDVANTEVYICGLKAMIHDVCEQLKGLGFIDDQILFEKYD